MCETKLASGQTIKNLLPNYQVCSRNIKAGEKGIAVCIKLQTFKSALDVTSSALEDIVVVRVEMAHCTVRIILGYAPQETDLVEVREQFFTELEIEIAKCKLVDELPIVVGDLNAKIYLNNGEVEATSPNGRLLLEIINNQELDVLNFHEKCEGKWTHVVRTSGSASVLDYIMTDKQVTETVEQIIIDENCVLCPFSVRKRKNGVEPKFSDHNAMILKMKMVHEKKKDRINSPKS